LEVLHRSSGEALFGTPPAQGAEAPKDQGQAPVAEDFIDVFRVGDSTDTMEQGLSGGKISSRNGDVTTAPRAG